MIETPEVFNAEQLVVVTSNFDIASMEWMDYMEENWEKLIRKKSRFIMDILYIVNFTYYSIMSTFFFAGCCCWPEFTATRTGPSGAWTRSWWTTTGRRSTD